MGDALSVASAPRAFTTAVDWLALLDDTGAGDTFRDRAGALVGAGARPFEAPVGAGLGPRLTWDTRGMTATADHPLGPPDWLGLRTEDGVVREKAYHAVGNRRLAVPFVLPGLPDGLPLSLVPKLVAVAGHRVELYLRAAGELSPSQLIHAANVVLGDEGPPLPLRPRAAPAGTGLSVRWDDGRPVAVTIVLWARALPEEAAVERYLRASLPDRERAVWECVVALQPEMGIPLSRRHHAVSWSRVRGGSWQVTDCLAVRAEGGPLQQRGGGAGRRLRTPS